MKNTMIALAAISVLTLGALGSAEARDQGRGHGAQTRTHAPAQHRAGPINAHRGAEPAHRAGHVGAGKRFWRAKGVHYRARPGRWQLRRVHRSVRWRHRPGPGGYHAHRAYASPGRSLGVDIETEGFRFSVNKSE